VELYGGPNDGLRLDIPKRAKEVIVHVQRTGGTLFDLDKPAQVSSARYTKRERHKFIYKEGAIDSG